MSFAKGAIIGMMTGAVIGVINGDKITSALKDTKRQMKRLKKRYGI